LEVRDRTQAAVLAIQNGLIDPDSLLWTPCHPDSDSTYSNPKNWSYLSYIVPFVKPRNLNSSSNISSPQLDLKWVHRGFSAIPHWDLPQSVLNALY
jgi:hypothetical protein